MTETETVPAGTLAKLERMREALIRATHWGIRSRGWHPGEALNLALWVEDGMNGPPPAIESPIVGADYELRAALEDTP